MLIFKLSLLKQSSVTGLVSDTNTQSYASNAALPKNVTSLSHKVASTESTS